MGESVSVPVAGRAPHNVRIRHDRTRLTDSDLYLFNEGSHFRLHDKLGAHPGAIDGEAVTFFAVWAPNAERVTVMGDFNGWNNASHDLRPRGSSGIWQGFVPGLGQGAAYKYHVASRFQGYATDRVDPFGFMHSPKRSPNNRAE